MKIYSASLPGNRCFSAGKDSKKISRKPQNPPKSQKNNNKGLRSPLVESSHPTTVQHVLNHRAWGGNWGRGLIYTSSRFKSYGPFSWEGGEYSETNEGFLQSESHWMDPLGGGSVRPKIQILFFPSFLCRSFLSRNATFRGE